MGTPSTKTHLKPGHRTVTFRPTIHFGEPFRVGAMPMPLPSPIPMAPFTTYIPAVSDNPTEEVELHRGSEPGPVTAPVPVMHSQQPPPVWRAGVMQDPAIVPKPPQAQDVEIVPKPPQAQDVEIEPKPPQ